MSVPESFSAIETGNTSFLFYVKRDGTITSLEQPSSEDELYKQQDILMGGNPVKTRVPRISVVAYTDQYKKRQVRIYYIGYKDNDRKPQLKELCQTDGGYWFEGKLSTRQFVQISEKSRISANVEVGQGDLKVFYLNEEDNIFVVAVDLNKEKWFAPQEVYGGPY